jgi:hypothetical protein
MTSPHEGWIGTRLKRAFDDKIIEDLTRHSFDLKTVPGTHRRRLLGARRLSELLKRSLQPGDMFTHNREFVVIPYHGVTSTIPRIAPVCVAPPVFGPASGKQYRRTCTVGAPAR